MIYEKTELKKSATNSTLKSGYVLVSDQVRRLRRHTSNALDIIVPSEWFDDEQLISEDFLVLRAVQFFVSQLLDRDVSIDIKYQSANLLVMIMNDVE